MVHSKYSLLRFGGPCWSGQLECELFPSPFFTNATICDATRRTTLPVLLMHLLRHHHHMVFAIPHISIWTTIIGTCFDAKVGDTQLQRDGGSEFFCLCGRIVEKRYSMPDTLQTEQRAFVTNIYSTDRESQVWRRKTQIDCPGKMSQRFSNIQ